MEYWEDQAIVLAVRPHGENGAIISLLTQKHGRHAGYFYGAHSAKNRGVLQLGNAVDVVWKSRVSENLGSVSLELTKNNAAFFMQDSLKLAALQSACALCDIALPEREGHPGLYEGFQVLCDTLAQDIWAAAYVMWEIALLRELGFSLDLSKCAGGGSADSLAYVSPKTGRAVSSEPGKSYKDKLLILPEFLKPQAEFKDNQDILMGLDLTGYFFMHWVFVHHSEGIPTARLLFRERFAKTNACSKDNSLDAA